VPHADDDAEPHALDESVALADEDDDCEPLTDAQLLGLIIPEPVPLALTLELKELQGDGELDGDPLALAHAELDDDAHIDGGADAEPLLLAQPDADTLPHAEGEGVLDALLVPHAEGDALDENEALPLEDMHALALAVGHSVAVGEMDDDTLPLAESVDEGHEVTDGEPELECELDDDMQAVALTLGEWLPEEHADDEPVRHSDGVCVSEFDDEPLGLSDPLEQPLAVSVADDDGEPETEVECDGVALGETLAETLVLAEDDKQSVGVGDWLDEDEPLSDTDAL